MKTITFLAIIFILFVPILNVSAASANTEALMTNPNAVTVDKLNNTPVTGVSDEKSMLEQIKEYAIDIKNYLMDLPNNIIEKIKEYLPEPIKDWLY